MSIGKLLAVAAAGVALAWCGAATANTYDFTYSAPGPTSVTASGVLTTVAAAGDTQFITGISGVFGGEAITTLLAPSSCCGIPPNDNLLFPNNDENGSASAYLDLAGFAFTAGAPRSMCISTVWATAAIPWPFLVATTSIRPTERHAVGRARACDLVADAPGRGRAGLGLAPAERSRGGLSQRASGT